MQQIIVFTDGASKGNPGPGGWGLVAVAGDRVVERGGGEKHTTNNRMELQAAIQALLLARELEAASVLLYSDSKYVLDGITKWIFSWKKNNWVTAAKKPVLNAGLWQQLHGLSASFGGNVAWKYVGGHIGIIGNERADVIASSFAEHANIRLFDGPLQQYPLALLPVFSESSPAGQQHAGPKKKAYSYVSLVDGMVRTHASWAECEAAVSGKRAKFRKAASAAEEAAIVQEFGRLSEA